LVGPLAIVALALLAAPGAAVAAPGGLDSAFGTGGVRTLAAGTGLNGVAVEPDRSVVAVGASGSSLLVSRFSAAGALAGTFAAGSGVGRAVVLQGDGKIVVAGNDGAGMLVERFNADGSLDGGFGSGGVVHAVAGGVANAVALGPGGSIVVAGQLLGGDAFQRVAILRLSSNGSPDTSFGPGGVRVVDLGQDSVAKGVAVQGDSKIVLAGSIGPGVHQITSGFVARVTASGALDPTFGGGSGLFVQSPQGGGAVAMFNAVALDPSGGIVVGGGGTAMSQSQALFARLTCAGALDPSFAGSGEELTPSSTTFAINPNGANGVAVAAGRRVVGAGTFQASGAISAGLWGFESNGSPDFVTKAPGGASAALAVDAAGDFVVAGTTNNFVSLNGFVARYLGYGAPASGSSPCGGVIPTPTPTPTRPVVSHAAQSHSSWGETKLRTRRRPVGTTFSFTLSGQARVVFTFTQVVGGRKVHGRCVAQTRQNRHKPACRRTVTKGTLSFTGHAGKNSFSFKGRISRSNLLRPGRYTLVITATNSAGVSKPQSLSFTIVS
jgi:uncharacterized delta-60 repeat protein